MFKAREKEKKISHSKFLTKPQRRTLKMFKQPNGPIKDEKLLWSEAPQKLQSFKGLLITFSHRKRDFKQSIN